VSLIIFTAHHAVLHHFKTTHPLLHVLFYNISTSP
jgi:hypothetical protein